MILDLTIGTLLDHGHDLGESTPLTFTPEQELEIELSLTRRAICVANNLVLDVPVLSTIDETETTLDVYVIDGTHYYFDESGRLRRQAFTLSDLVPRTENGAVNYGALSICLPGIHDESSSTTPSTSFGKFELILNYIFLIYSRNFCEL